VRVISTVVSFDSLHKPDPWLRVRFLIRNATVYPMSLSHIAGHITFEHAEFEKSPEVITPGWTPNEPVAAGDSIGVEVRQWLSERMAERIRSATDKTFDVSGLTFFVQGHDPGTGETFDIPVDGGHPGEQVSTTGAIASM
jgi:hypothetical protein